MDAEAMKAEEENMGKTGAELATAIGRASDDEGREMSGSIVGGTCIETSAKAAGADDTS